MACNYCNRVFSLFRLEKPCPSCGFSYCLKCLNNTVFVKKLKTEKKVCIRCSQYNSSGEVHMIPPPDCYRKITQKAKFCQNNTNENNDEDKKTRQNGRNSNVSNKNYDTDDENSPSTSNGLVRVDPESMYKKEKIRAEESDYDDDDDSSDSLEENSVAVVEIGKKLKYCFRNKYSRVRSSARYRRRDRPRQSSDKILRDAIKQLEENLRCKADSMDAILKMPRTCVLCSTNATVTCKGCASIFCMRCFDMHSDDVCVEYEPLAGNAPK